MGCHLRPPDVIPLPSYNLCGASRVGTELQTNSLSFHLDSLWGATLTPFRVCAMDWQWIRTPRAGKNSGFILSCLWAEVDEILRRYRRPFVVPEARRRLSISCFVPKIFAVEFAV